MTKEITEISLVGTLRRIKGNQYDSYHFNRKEAPASMTLTLETNEPDKGIGGLIYDNARITITIEVDSEPDFAGHIPE